MINLTKLEYRETGSAIAYLQATEYYLDKDGTKQEMMRWGGKGAKDLGLIGKAVSREDMDQLAQGYSPTGEALCRNAGEKPVEEVKLDKNGQPRIGDDGKPMTVLKGGHIIGYDMTFSPPKDPSVLFALASPEERDKILAIHNRAVDRCLSEFESKYVETRRGQGGRDVIGVEGLVYSVHTHLASRDLDCQLHSHALIYGVAKGADGQWGTYDSAQLFDNYRAMDEVYKNELYTGLRELGYKIEQKEELDDLGKPTGKRYCQVKGISQEIQDEFSKRRQAILSYQEEHGVDTQTANFATRRHKDEPTFDEMVKMWTQTIEGMDQSFVKSIDELKQEGNDTLLPKRSPEQILAQLHATSSVFKEKDLIQILGQEYAGEVDLDGLHKQIEQFKQDAGLVVIEPERLAREDQGQTLSRRYTEDRFCAPWMVEWEKEISAKAQERQGEEHLKLDKEMVATTIEEYEAEKGFTLSYEQREAIEHLTCGTGGVGVLSGLAGTGKTTVSDVYSRAFQKEGYTMRGVAVSNMAAQKLELESGMPSLSVAKTLSMLDSKQMTLSEKDVIVLDEAGMVATKEARELMAYCDRFGAKLIMQGDASQLQPVGAGSGFSLVKDQIGDKSLTQIRRQKREEDRQIARAFYDFDEEGKPVQIKQGDRSRSETLAKGRQIYEMLDKRGMVDEFDKRDDAIKALVDDYVDSPLDHARKLLMAHSRADVKALNLAVRASLQDKGLIEREEFTFKAMDNRQLTDLTLARGDLVRFGAREDKLGVVNGSQGTVEDIKPSFAGGYDITVALKALREGGEDERITFNSYEYRALSHNYAKTIHKVQGQGEPWVRLLANKSMTDNQAGLVAFTRLSGEDFKVYGTVDDIEGFRDRLGLDRLKTNATQEGIREPYARSDNQQQEKGRAGDERATYKSVFDRKAQAIEKERQERPKHALTKEHTDWWEQYLAQMQKGDQERDREPRREAEQDRRRGYELER